MQSVTAASSSTLKQSCMAVPTKEHHSPPWGMSREQGKLRPMSLLPQSKNMAQPKTNHTASPSPDKLMQSQSHTYSLAFIGLSGANVTVLNHNSPCKRSFFLIHPTSYPCQPSRPQQLTTMLSASFSTVSPS